MLWIIYSLIKKFFFLLLCLICVSFNFFLFVYLKWSNMCLSLVMGNGRISGMPDESLNISKRLHFNPTSFIFIFHADNSESNKKPSKKPNSRKKEPISCVCQIISLLFQKLKRNLKTLKIQFGLFALQLFLSFLPQIIHCRV